MAEGALFHLAGKVLELLGSSILQEVNLTFGVKTEIENLTKEKFEESLWVCISDIFEVKVIVKEILKQLTKEKFEESLEMLQNRL